MSALPQPNFRDVVNSSPQPRVSSATSSKILSNTTKLSRKKSSSAALQLLILLQKSSSLLAAVVMLTSMGIYLATVRIPQLWSQEYKHLEALQRQERNLVAMDESLKYEIAQQAEQPELEMSAIAPENVLFLEANSVELPQKAISLGEKQETIASNSRIKQTIPLGY